MKKSRNIFCSRLREFSIVVVVTCLVSLPGKTGANEVQWRICNAALGLGQAEARIELFGRAMDGEIPIDQREDIQTNLNNAAAEMAAAEALMVGPIAKDRAEKRTLAKVTDKIARFATTVANLPYQRQSSYVAGIFGMYRQGLEVTFESSRGDALRYNANCDVFVALTCYNYGKATIASTIDLNFGDAYQNGANGSFRNAVYKGLSVAMDQSDTPGDPGHSPWDGHAKKICCTMGTPMDWQAMDLGSFTSLTPLEVYAEREGILLSIIGTAIELDPICASSGERCASSSRLGRDGREGGNECNRIIGRWKWFNGGALDFRNGGKWQTADGVHTGTWICNQDGTYSVRPDVGEWRDRLTISGDSNSLSGSNQYGTQVSATRIAIGDETPESCSAENARLIFELFDPPPYSGRSPVCVSGQGIQWTQTGSTMYRIKSLVKGEYSEQDRCYYNSRIVTEAREFAGTLCPK